jgi:hypothetical protein
VLKPALQPCRREGKIALYAREAGGEGLRDGQQTGHLSAPKSMSGSRFAFAAVERPSCCILFSSGMLICDRVLVLGPIRSLIHTARNRNCDAASRPRGGAQQRIKTMGCITSSTQSTHYILLLFLHTTAQFADFSLSSSPLQAPAVSTG